MDHQEVFKDFSITINFLLEPVSETGPSIGGDQVASSLMQNSMHPKTLAKLITIVTGRKFGETEVPIEAG